MGLHDSAHFADILLDLHALVAIHIHITWYRNLAHFRWSTSKAGRFYWKARRFMGYLLPYPDRFPYNKRHCACCGDFKGKKCQGVTINFQKRSRSPDHDSRIFCGNLLTSRNLWFIGCAVAAGRWPQTFLYARSNQNVMRVIRNQSILHVDESYLWLRTHFYHHVLPPQVFLAREDVW